MSALLYWTGAAVWFAAACAIFWFVAEIAVGFVCACSWSRWVLAVHQAHGDRPLTWAKFPKAFWGTWVEMIGHRNDGRLTITCDNGRWKGIGDWTVYPKEQEPENG